VRAETCVNGAIDLRSRLQIAEIHGANAQPVNFALAYAHSCSTGCEAVAVAFQVDLVDQAATNQSPQNAAIALNYECNQCAVFAYADQYAIDVPPGTHLPGTTRQQLEAIGRQAQADVQSSVSFPVLDSELHALAAKIASDVQNGLSQENVQGGDGHSVQHVKQHGRRFRKGR
jgi:hypothetical protein